MHELSEYPICRVGVVMALDWQTQRVYVGQKCRFRVNRTTVGSPALLKVQLKSAVDWSVVNGRVECAPGDQFEVSVTPTIRGRHELSALVGGSHVIGSPWTLFVYQPLETLGVQIRELTCDPMTCPLDVAVNQGKVYVSCHLTQQIVIFTIKGDRLATIGGLGRPPFAPLHGPPYYLAPDDEGNIYVTTANSILKLSSQGEILASTDACGEVGDGPTSRTYGIALYGGEAYVCDSDNSRIQVYDANLGFVRTCGSKATCESLHKPFDLSFDSAGNVYVAASCCIHVLGRDGRACLSHFGHQGAEGAVVHPYGISVFGDHVFICEHYEHYVSVFHTSGRYVTRLGQCGVKKGEFKHPWGVDVDEDGFVYVCDSISNRIQVF